ncbi:MAG: bifunctional aspartate kinase/diaminopimelate decarboxylase [Deltaproteobacteria bacterium]|nr:bifunctional aspartate kinase/diaminopimelate decarboxylase [Deltaproteobacteria bacterium]
MNASRPFVVLKFGGTSVATPERWGRIAARVRALLPEHRVWIVASALSQVSNQLEAAIEQALAGSEELPALEWIEQRHEELATGIGLDREAMKPVRTLLTDLGRLLRGIRLTQEASPRLRARVLSFGELASTWLGAAALAHYGVPTQRLDARDLLTARRLTQQDPVSRYLSAVVEPEVRPARVEPVVGDSQVVITQGFIARDMDGDTVLLGRGGSDTSGSLFAALLNAARLEIWTDVHGCFTTDPRQHPGARLIKRMGYAEARELAAMGAKVLHPRSVGPAAFAGIPIHIRNTGDPHAEGTIIEAVDAGEPALLAVVKRDGVVLLTISTLEMWGAPGFLARVFAPFEELAISVDLVATSQAAVSVTLDGIPGGVDGSAFAALVERLRTLGTVDVQSPCSVVSIVGRRIRAALHELAPAFAAFREQTVHLVSESSEDMNLSFVVDPSDADALVARLHGLLVPRQGGTELFGPTWELLTEAHAEAVSKREAARPGRWWVERREELLALVEDGQARYVYDLPTVSGRARALRVGVPSVHRIHYAIKANWHPDVLRAVASEGIAMECVSLAEIRHVRETLGDDVPILFTPNFCPVEEYAEAFALGAEVTVDGPNVLRAQPGIFSGREIALRVDPGEGLGHHKKVRTAGAHAKFGQPVSDLDALWDATVEVGARVVGLHSHVGSGILDAGAWKRTAETLTSLIEGFPDVRWLDLGGGLGVVERPGQEPLDLTALDRSLAAVLDLLRAQWPGRELTLRLEPGRWFVSEGGVLLAPVTQVRAKGAVSFVGVATGMNSLLRPALYGAWHGIHNLTRHGAPDVGYHHVVGPICETGDILGRDRLLPVTEPGDVLIIENAGAYGRVMASRYNLREPASEVVLP